MKQSITVVKSKSLLGGYNLMINGSRKYHFVMKRDAEAKRNQLSQTVKLLS